LAGGDRRGWRANRPTRHPTPWSFPGGRAVRPARLHRAPEDAPGLDLAPACGDLSAGQFAAENCRAHHALDIGVGQQVGFEARPGVLTGSLDDRLDDQPVVDLDQGNVRPAPLVISAPIERKTSS